MTRKAKRFITVSLLLVFSLSLMISFCMNTYAIETETITVTLTPDDTSAAASNWYELDDAISQASSNRIINVKISAAGTYYIGKTDTAAAIRLRSNTILDLNNSTLKRYNQMGNMVQCCDYDGVTGDSEYATGYNLASNITIKNGTFDGAAGNPAGSANLLNFGHASGITLENLDIINSRGGHLVEFTGCNNVSVKSCTFEGLNSSNMSAANEALQLDICAGTTTGGQEWNGIYAKDNTPSADNTPCKNVRIENCHFFDYPSAIGNHKGVKGIYTSNVVITNNYFENTLSTKQPAIWAYNFANSTIEDNRISGNYSQGIYVSGGKSNTIDSNTVELAGESLYITVASSSYISESGGSPANMFVSNCSVLNNKFTTTGAVPTVGIYSSSHVAEFSGNTVKASKEKAVTISTNSQYSTNTKVDLIKNNTITDSHNSDSSYGLHFSAATIGSVLSNKVTSYARAIWVGSGTTATEISKNTVTSKTYDGIYVSAATVNKINSNTISNCKVDSIAVINGSTAGTVSGNTISNSGSYGIRVANSTVTTAGNNTITSSVSDGIYITGDTAKLANITGNTIKSGQKSGINCTGTAKVSKVQNNTITGNTEYGVWIKNANITVGMGQNSYSSNKLGNEKISAKVTKLAASGLPAPALGGATNTSSGVKVTWSAVKFAEKYRVFYKTSGGSWTKLGDTTSTSYVHKAAKSGTTYYYTVRPMNSNNTFSGDYDTKGVSVKFIAAPKAKLEGTNTGIKVSWPASKGAAKYRVFIKNSSGEWVKVKDTTGLSIAYTNVTAGKTYTFTVRCMDSNGKYISAFYSSGFACKFAAAPKAPTLKNSAKGVVIKWGATTGAVKYRIFYKTSKSGSWTKLADTTSTSYTHTAAKSGTTYYYTVRCISSDSTTFTSGYNTTGSYIKCKK